jgi:hypothetical protein
MAKMRPGDRDYAEFKRMEARAQQALGMPAPGDMRTLLEGQVYLMAKALAAGDWPAFKTHYQAVARTVNDVESQRQVVRRL